MPGFEKLELEFQEPFTAWQREPTKANTGALLKAVKPAIERGISASVGRKVSPALRSHARRLTLGAIRSYDPHQARLTTHIINHLRGLRRISRKQQTVLSTPERVALDRQFLSEAETELEDRLGRPPSAGELADHTKLSFRRIKYVRSFQPAVAEGSLLAMSGRDSEQTPYSPAVEQTSGNAVLSVVYDDLDPVNQNIMDWTLGLHGCRPANNAKVAARLKISPGAVSQRKALIQRKLDQAQSLGIF